MTLAIIGFLSTVNPGAATLALAHNRRADRPLPVVVGVLLALMALAAMGASAEWLLDGLDVNLGTYRLGAGVVIAASGLRWLVIGHVPPAEEPESAHGLAAFVAFPTLVTPGAAALAVSIGAGEASGEGLGPVAAGAAIAVAIGGLGLYARRILQPAMVAGVVRLLGAASGVIGVIIAVDGIRTL